MYSKLRKINGKLKEKFIISFDVETYGNENTFLLGTTYQLDGSFIFYDKLLMCDYLLSFDNKFLIVASNLEFDFNVLFFNSKYFYEFKPIKNGTSLIALIYDKYGNRKAIKFIDSYNYMKCSVETYGEILNTYKLKKPEFLGMIPKTINELNELIIYCFRDSEITYKFMKFLQKGFNNIGCELKLTIASTSIDLYKRKYLPCIVESEENRFKHINKKLFNSYFGGRTEIFSRGFIRNYNYYDYNSMYPSVMLREYPNPNYCKYVTNPTKDIIEYEGVSKVILECPFMNIPLLPIVYEKLIFPIGTLRGTYTNMELREAVKIGYKIKYIFYSIYYTKTFFPFKDFVIDIYNKRKEFKELNNPIEIVYKLLLNSLYGKFGQKKLDETRFIDLNNEIEKEKIFKEFPNAKYTINKDGKGYLQQPKICTSNFVRPIFSIYTTAYARVKIFNDISKYKTIYIDTDSIISKKEIPESKLLGDLKKETFIKKGVFVKPKMYCFTDNKNNVVTKLKGIPRANEDIFKKILNSKPHEYMKFSRMTESIKKGIIPNTRQLISKKVNLEDNKRVWNMRFNPYIFDDYSKPHKVIMK